MSILSRIGPLQNARDNITKRDYFERFGIAEGFRRLAQDYPYRPQYDISIPGEALINVPAITSLNFVVRISWSDGQCVGDRILRTICCSRTKDLGLHIAVHARKKSFLRHTAGLALYGKW